MGGAEIYSINCGEQACDVVLHAAGQRQGGWHDMHDRQGSRHDTDVASRRGSIIKGITSAGYVFRPSDWAQRMAAAGTVNCSYCSGRGEGRYNPHVRVIHVDGVTCLWVAEALREIDPPLHAFIMHFARDNHLKVVES